MAGQENKHRPMDMMNNFKLMDWENREVDKADMRNHSNQPSMKDITASAEEGMTKEPWRDKVDRASKRGHTQFTLGMASRDVPITQTKENRRAFLKAASDCDPSSFATLDRLGGVEIPKSN